MIVRLLNCDSGVRDDNANVSDNANAEANAKSTAKATSEQSLDPAKPRGEVGVLKRKAADGSAKG